MSVELVTERMRQADPAGTHTRPPATVVSPAALLAELDQRSGDMQTQDKPVIEQSQRPPQHKRRLVAALAGAMSVIVLIVITVAILSTDDEPDATNNSPVSSTPREAGDALNAAIVAGDLEAALGLFAQDATYTDRFLAATGGGSDLPISEAGVPGMIQKAYLFGITKVFDCVQGDATTVECTVVEEGNPFGTPEVTGKVHTLTVVDGLITSWLFEEEIRVVPGASAAQFEYEDWVLANHPEMLEKYELFEFPSRLVVNEATIEIHRQLIAEWKAQR